MTNPIDWTQKYFSLNKALVDINEFSASYFDCEKTIYEVIKVIDNAPLFYTEHISRLNRSCNLAGYQCPSNDFIFEGIEKLLNANPVELKNIRISLCFSNPISPICLCYFVESHYPTKDDYLTGVRVEILRQSRKNPNVKADNPPLRSAADAIIKSQKVYETLLVDESDFITECSRSNFFAVRGNLLITPPAQDVLEGVTRLKVIQLSKANGIECVERKMKFIELSDFDGAFITGTSRGVLPLKCIGDNMYNTQNPLIQQLISLYNDEVIRDIDSWKSKFAH